MEIAMLRLCRTMSLAGILLGAAALQARGDDAVITTFEKYKLLGTFAPNCNQPPSNGNPYFIVRPVVGAGRVVSDRMMGRGPRNIVSVVIDKATVPNPDTIVVSGTREGQPLEISWQIENNRQRAVEATIGGKKEISGGRWVSNGRDVGWINKCDVAGQQAASSGSWKPGLGLTVDDSTNREGDTIREFNIDAADPGLCQARCIGEAQCTAWVYRAPGGRTDGKPHCWLRNSITEVARSDSLTSSGLVRADVKSVFEKYKLLGVFAADCDQPA